MNQFYSYAYLDPRKPGPYEYDGCRFPFEPFYVGKGCRDRHLPKAHKQGFCGRKVKKIGYDKVLVSFLLKNVSEKEAVNMEKLMIATIGKLHDKTGPLVNMTDGGEGTNRYFSRLHRQRISEASKGKKLSQETKEKISQAGKGRKHSKETIEKIRITSTGRKHSEETRAKMSKVQKLIAKYSNRNIHYGKKRSDETKLKMRNAQLGKRASKETREKLRQIKLKNPIRYWQGKIGPNKGIIQNEEWKQKRAESFRKTIANRKRKDVDI